MPSLPVQTRRTSRARASLTTMPPPSPSTVRPSIKPSQSAASQACDPLTSTLVVNANASNTIASTAIVKQQLPAASITAQAHAMATLPEHILPSPARAIASLREAMTELQALTGQIKKIRATLDRHDSGSARTTRMVGSFTSTSTTKAVEDFNGSRQIPSPTESISYSSLDDATPSNQHSPVGHLHRPPASQLPVASSQPSSTANELEASSTQSPGNNAPLPPASSTVADSVSNLTLMLSPTLASYDASHGVEMHCDIEPTPRKRKRFAGVWDDVVGDLDFFIHAPSPAPVPLAGAPLRRKSGVSKNSRASSLRNKNRRTSGTGTSLEGKGEDKDEDRDRKRTRHSARSMTMTSAKEESESDEEYFEHFAA